MKPWTQPPLRGLGGSVLPVGALDLTIRTGAGRRSFTVVPVFADLPGDVILGADYLLSSDVEVHIERGQVHLRPSTVGRPSPTIDEGESTFLDDLILLLERHKALFADNTAQLPGTNLLAHSIPTGDHPPVCVPLRRYAEKERTVIDEQVLEMLNAGIIRHSSSPWAAPVVLVRKKDGTLRFCVDYRELNKHTIPDSYPLPRIDDALDMVRKSKFFSSLDLRAGHCRLPFQKRIKTAFRTPSGLFEFNRMPFGLRTAPSTFQRAMDSVLGTLKEEACVVYFIDILVIGSIPEEHLQNLDQVLTRLYEAGFRLNREKCQLGATSMPYLGYRISTNGMEPLPERIAAVLNYPTPTNLKEVQSFLGVTSYLRKFIPHFASTAASLTDLTKKNARFVWGAAQ